MLESFALTRFRFFLEPENLIQLHPQNPGNTLRGAFGLTFKQLVCPTPQECRNACQRKHRCPYGQIFEPSPPPQAGQLRRNMDIPRPFVYRPLTTHGNPDTDEPLTFELILIGKAIGMFPYFLVTFRELGHHGLGLIRGKFRIRQVLGKHSLHGKAIEVYAERDGIVRTDMPTLTFQDCIQAAQRYPLQTTQRVTVRFLTPTHLKADGTLVRQPDFHHLIKRVRDRINALAYFYSGETLEMDYKAFGVRAESIRTVSRAIRWVDQTRRSWKSGRHHEMGGFVGKVTYEGDFTEFLPLLILGQYTHVGKYAVWGNGWYEVLGNRA